ncbi:hypothetical protein [Streptomyces sp. SA15]|nr:hypothetical protein [Streptomyces sp. SA15]
MRRRRGQGDRRRGHLALWEGRGDGGPETTWLEKVTDEQYRAPRTPAH